MPAGIDSGDTAWMLVATALVVGARRDYGRQALTGLEADPV